MSSPHQLDPLRAKEARRTPPEREHIEQRVRPGRRGGRERRLAQPERERRASEHCCGDGDTFQGEGEEARWGHDAWGLTCRRGRGGEAVVSSWSLWLRREGVASKTGRAKQSEGSSGRGRRRRRRRKTSVRHPSRVATGDREKTHAVWLRPFLRSTRVRLRWRTGGSCVQRKCCLERGLFPETGNEVRLGTRRRKRVVRHKRPALGMATGAPEYWRRRDGEPGALHTKVPRVGVSVARVVVRSSKGSRTSGASTRARLFASPGGRRAEQPPSWWCSAGATGDRVCQVAEQRAR